MSSINGTASSRQTSPFPEAGAAQDLDHSYMPPPPLDSCEPWGSGIPCSVPSTVSSPTSSGNTEDYGSAYIPTSAPAPMAERIPSSSVVCLRPREPNMEFDDMRPGKDSHTLTATGGLYLGEANHI